MDSTVRPSKRSVVVDRQRVRDDGRRDAAVLQAVHRRAGQHAVRRRDDDVLRAVVEEQFGRLGDRAAGVDHVVDEDAGLAGDLADDLADLDLVGDVRVAALVDDRQAAAEAVGPALGDAHPAGVRRDDDEVAVAPLRLDVVGEQRQREQVVDRAVEEALDLRGVQVDRHEPVGAGGLEHVGDQARADRLATPVLLVLAGVRVEGQHDGDALGRGALERVHHEQRLHQPGVHRRRDALHDEGVGAAHRLLEAHEDLAVGELVGAGRHRVDAERGADLLRELGVGAPGEQHEVLAARDGDAAHDCFPRSVGRLRATQPSMLRCLARPTPSAPAGTSSVMTEPAAV